VTWRSSIARLRSGLLGFVLVRSSNENHEGTATLIPDQGEILAESLNQALADVTADPGVDSVTIDIPKDKCVIYDTLAHSGFKIRKYAEASLTMGRVLR